MSDKAERPEFAPILAQIRAGWNEIKDLELPAAETVSVRDLAVHARLRAVQAEAEQFRNACRELVDAVALAAEKAVG